MHDGHWTGNLYFVGPQDSRRWAVRQLAWLKGTSNLLAILVEALSAEEREICVGVNDPSIKHHGPAPVNPQHGGARRHAPDAFPPYRLVPSSRRGLVRKISKPIEHLVPWLRALLAIFFFGQNVLRPARLGDRALYVINVDVLTARLMGADGRVASCNGTCMSWAALQDITDA
ncbi:hypothetical protein BC826DRAFT_458466 [Russula brevipes]|nr:hypothetical protein BC826DRAFT_458466 [Russula brevipes]